MGVLVAIRPEDARVNISFKNRVNVHTVCGNRSADYRTDCLVEFQHVQEIAADLGDEEGTDGDASSDISLEDIIQNLDILSAGKHIDVAGRLHHKRVPLQNKISVGVKRQLNDLTAPLGSSMSFWISFSWTGLLGCAEIMYPIAS